MPSQLSYTAAKLEIADRQRRAAREHACGEPAKNPHAQPRRNPLARLVSLRRTASAPVPAPAGTDAA